MTASPPPTTAGAPGGEAPPLTSFAWRHGLIRPVQGRTFAGVSGALARATNTDPVLWKVILVVLTLFGLIGVLIYLLAWLLLPADGDTATPVEALGGRGHSRTSAVRAIVGIVVAGLMLAGYVTEPFRATPLVAIALLAGVLLVLLRDHPRDRTPTGVPGQENMPYAPPPPATPPGTPAAPFPPPPGGTAPPFAPQGPFPPPPGAPRPPWGPPPAARWQPPPAPPRPRSRLGQLTVSLAVLLFGGLIAADLLGFEIATLAYLAGPLAVLGLGLIVGAWLGRARWLIPLGIVLMLLLGGGYAALGDGYWNRGEFGVVSLNPQSVEEVRDQYRRNVGAIEMDLSDVDFAGTRTEIDLSVNLGAIEVLVPSDVDVTVNASVDVGSAVVFGSSWDGFGAGAREVFDAGPDGVGGGELHITAAVNTGSIEIHRHR